MTATAPSIRIGPLSLAPGITRTNFWSLMYASFIGIGMLAGMNILQPYILAEHLQVPYAEQGRVTGNLAFWQEIIAILLIKPFGVLSDRVGRRPILVFGVLVIGVGFTLYPFATSVNELMGYRALFAVGAAAIASVISIVTNDYPVETSRGKLQGCSSLMIALGVLFMSLFVAQIPGDLRERGYDAEESGQAMFLFAALLCFASSIVFRVGLKSGVPIAEHERKPWRELLLSGFRAGRNPRVLLSYACAFTGRADNALKGTFVSLWALQAAPEAGMTAAAALGRAGIVTAFMGMIGLVWTPLFGYLLDRFNRVSGVALAMVLAAAGFISMGFISSPLDNWTLPLFAVLSLGQTSATLASVTLVGQEATPAERGSIIAMNGWCGAVGILLAAVIGGRLFDTIAPAAPFVMIGVLQAVLAVVALSLRWRMGASFAAKPAS